MKIKNKTPTIFNLIGLEWKLSNIDLSIVSASKSSIKRKAPIPTKTITAIIDLFSTPKKIPSINKIAPDNR